MMLNTPHNEDCVTGMAKRFGDNTIDIFVTSPPYNIGTKYNQYNDKMSHENYLTWLDSVFSEVSRTLKDNGSFFLNVGQKCKDDFRCFDIAKVASKYLCLQNTIHWIKSIASPKHGFNVGHFKPVNSERYLNNCHEYIFHFTKEGVTKIDKLANGVPYKDKSNVGRYSDTDLRDRGNVWFIPYNTVAGEKKHPASFPLDLPKMCIKLHGYDTSTIVCDPFMGIGTTKVACYELGVRWIGFEIDKSYLNKD